MPWVSVPAIAKADQMRIFEEPVFDIDWTTFAEQSKAEYEALRSRMRATRAKTKAVG